MSNDTFTHAGTSVRHGKCKVRTANSADRIKVLIKTDHTDIDLIQLKVPMTKADAVEYLISINFDNGNPIVRAALEEAQADIKAKAEKAAKPPKEPKATKAPNAPTMDELAARAAAKIASDQEDRNKEEAFLKEVANQMNSKPVESPETDELPY